MFIFPLSFWLLLAEEFFVRRLLSCNRNYVSVYFLSPEGLSFFHGLIYNSCNASTESGFARLSECGEVKDESQRSPIGNLSTASWKPLALYVMSCITSDVPNCKPQRASFHENPAGFICLCICICKASHVPCPFSGH